MFKILEATIEFVGFSFLMAVLLSYWIIF